jgi:hypothetical protein
LRNWLLGFFVRMVLTACDANESLISRQADLFAAEAAI